ncbi:hypothetical protein DFH07DRAFT_732287, partial [Mycena maculata]
QDDAIPLGTPVVTPSGEVISNFAIARSEAFWGPDAKASEPEHGSRSKKR